MRSDDNEDRISENRVSAARDRPVRWRTVSPLVMGSALNPINSSVIATALVPIAAALHVPVGRTSILVSSLYLACAIAQPTAGKLAEEFGPRRVFLTGIVLNPFCSAAWSAVWAMTWPCWSWPGS